MKKYYHIPTTSVMDLSTIRTLMMGSWSSMVDPTFAPARKNTPVGKLYI